jgi:hypothetical protein
MTDRSKKKLEHCWLEDLKESEGIFFRVAEKADPHSFHPDPDPAFQKEYRFGSGSDPDPGL